MICQLFLPGFNCNQNVSSDFSYDTKYELHLLPVGAALCYADRQDEANVHFLQMLCKRN